MHYSPESDESAISRLAQTKVNNDDALIELVEALEEIKVTDERIGKNKMSMLSNMGCYIVY